MREKEKSTATGTMRCAMFIHKVSKREPQLCAHSIIFSQNTKNRPRRIAKKAAVSAAKGYSDGKNIKEKG